VIYIASKTKHAPRWRELRAQGVPLISTWIDEAGKGETKSFSDLWDRCVLEACTSYVLVAYREPGEIQKGSFIEIGAALAMRVPVFIVGYEEEQFSFRHHPRVTSCSTLQEALTLAQAECSRLIKQHHDSLVYK